MVAADQLIPDTLVITYLEMTELSQFRPAVIEDAKMQISLLKRVDVEFYLFLYKGVGWEYHWRDRVLMPHDELEQALAAPTTSVYVLYYENCPAGYVELSVQGDSTEIIYFGLRQAYMGIGLGKHLLSFGIEQAWANGAKRLWVHTCNLDGTYAIDNYRKRGFQVYDTEEQPMPSRYRE